MWGSLVDRFTEIVPVSFTRRAFLASSAAMPFAPPAFGQSGAAPIVFVHGNGDHAALWMTTLWRFETNGWPGDRLNAINFTDPLSRPDDAVPMAGRSGADDQLRELAGAVDATLARTGASRVALVASSRGGNAVRNFVVENGGSAKVSHAILCGTPNRGVFALDANRGSEFNGRGPFLSRLNARDTDVTPGTAFMALYSDGNDKFAQPDGRFIGQPGVATGITTEGATLRGATNVALGVLDHREVAFHPRAFREMFRFIAGREPDRLSIAAQASVRLDGLVTGNPGGVPSNRPVAGARLSVFRVNADTGERLGGALIDKVTAADGRWGPLSVGPADALEFELSVEGHPVTHTYRSAFPRSSDVVHLRPARPLTDAQRAAGAVIQMSRPRGYFGIPRDVVLLDGETPRDVTPGVPTDSVATRLLPASEIGRAVVGLFNEERIVARARPASENRIAIIEITA